MDIKLFFRSLFSFLFSTIKLMLAGVVWLLLPSIILYFIGVQYGSPNPYLTATNAFVFWIFIHILVVGYGRISMVNVKDVVANYHAEYALWMKRYRDKTGEDGFDLTLDQIKNRLKQ